MQITLKTIPSKEKRYETVGDWWGSFEDAQIRVCNLKNRDSEFLVLVHEMIEWYLCERKNISDYCVRAHDEMFEEERARGLHDEYAEPGDDPRSPYFKEHHFAETVERLLALEMGVDWRTHNELTPEGVND